MYRTGHSKGNPRLSDVRRFLAHLRDISSYAGSDFYDVVIQPRRVPVTAVTVLRTPNSDWRQVASSFIKDKDDKEKKYGGGGVLREFMVDQRDTLQYMGATLCYADDFFDGRATYQVKSPLQQNRCLRWKNGRSTNTVLVGPSRMRSATRAELSQRSRSTDCCNGSIFHLR